MTTAELRLILEHLPDHLPVYIHGHGIVNEVRRPHHNAGNTIGLHLDVRPHDGLVLKGLFIDRRTLDVRLQRLAEAGS